MQQRCLLFLVVAISLTLMFPCTPQPREGPRHENAIPGLLPTMPKKEMGVYDIREVLWQRVSPDIRPNVELTSATCDVRPILCDGDAKYIVVVRFLQPGRYTIIMTRDGREQPYRRELTIRVRKRPDASPGISVDAVFHPESNIIEAAPGQLITLFWNGAPAWAFERKWDLISITTIPMNVIAIFYDSRYWP